jgi:hypothetical protein
MDKVDRIDRGSNFDEQDTLDVKTYRREYLRLSLHVVDGSSLFSNGGLNVKIIVIVPIICFSFRRNTIKLFGKLSAKSVTEI